MAKIRQLVLLIWKNFKLQFRHPWVTLLELGVPAFFSLCLVFIRSVITSEYVSDPIIYEPFSIASLPQNLTIPGHRKWLVLYAPDADFITKVMEDIAVDLDVRTAGFKNEDLMLEHYSNNTSVVLSGIVFDSIIENGINDTENIKYKVRPKAAEGGNSAFKNTLKTWFTEYTFALLPALGPRNRYSAWGGSPGYMSQGFLTLQHAVAMSLIQNSLSNSSEDIKNIINVEMCRYPYPPYLDDKFIVALQLFLPMIICFSFIYPAVNIVKNLVIEKEKKLKEAMKMMGLSRWLHWTAWYFKYTVLLFVSCGIITLLLCVKFHEDIAVINASDPSVILFWLLFYSMSTISFCFLISTLFSKEGAQ